MDSHVEAAIRARLSDHAEEWFPGRRAPSDWHAQLLSTRPDAELYVFRLADSGTPGGVLAKIRSSRPDGVGSGASPGRAPARPMLTAGPLDRHEATTREFQGLTRIDAALRHADGRFRAVRPLALLPEHDAILMDFVPAPSLRDDLVRRSRLVPSRSGAPTGDTTEPWHQVGRWLRSYQEATPSDGLVRRHDARQEVIDQFLAYDDHLTQRLGSRTFGGLGRRAAELAEAVLPQSVPVAPGHHDFAPRNVLVADDGRISVIDPLWRWAVPAQEDLCRFLVGMRLLGLQVHTHGLAFDRTELERLQDRVVAGYYGSSVPWAQLRTYEVLILLDKWAALVARGSGKGAQRRVLGLSLRFATGFIAGEVIRVLEAAEDATD